MKATYLIKYTIKESGVDGMIHLSANCEYEALAIFAENNLNGAIVATSANLIPQTARLDAFFDKCQEENDAYEFGYYDGDYHDEPCTQGGV